MSLVPVLGTSLTAQAGIFFLDFLTECMSHKKRSFFIFD